MFYDFRLIENNKKQNKVKENKKQQTS